ncbi:MULTISPECIES: acetyl-CoA C-acyltransferase [unclassified Arthrobacter]|uniref:thiolase family protein n=1 Tax=unclassified Arthrobacter TaxID=235627 RepID=UPI001CFFC94E|nr:MULTISPECIES: acetyl-CoA C-acyltransferase [unclassified Arthrobacter]MCB5282674.1 Beta-ketoadipyl-CoA thiolase [Arthrobacter sp. ES1]WGZ79136.1 acetyl-CoA C-acyltransferase [Arthrobacter sp. EM1]
MPEAFLVGGVRTPVGRHGGALATVRPDDLAALVLQAVVARAGVDPASIDEVILGCANQAGEDNRNVARMAVLLAGLPEAVPAVTVNRLCASGLTAVSMAAQAVRNGDAELVVAGGVESMTRAPWVLAKPEKPYAKPGELADTSIGARFVNPRMESNARFSMPETAEEVAGREGISRADADSFALRSHELALAAIDAGRFRDEIVPVPVTGRRGEVSLVDTDEGPRRGSTAESLAGLRPLVKPGGIVTAGNSSSLNDGASAVVVASGEAVARYGLTPRARIVTSQAAGVAPDVMGIGPVPATRKALAKAGWSLDDVGAVELNEAFAAQSLACMRLLGMDAGTVNNDGGAIALGHPLGSSGSRIVVTLLGRMERENAGRGLATMCVGLGQGVAMLLERV